MRLLSFNERRKLGIIARFSYKSAPTEGRQVKHFLRTVQTMATGNAYPQKAQASFDSDSARKGLSETLALSKRAIDQLNEARRVRPEQLNAPITL